MDLSCEMNFPHAGFLDQRCTYRFHLVGFVFMEDSTAAPDSFLPGTGVGCHDCARFQ
jgi:hypothetical protein